MSKIDIVDGRVRLDGKPLEIGDQIRVRGEFGPESFDETIVSLDPHDELLPLETDCLGWCKPGMVLGRVVAVVADEPDITDADLDAFEEEIKSMVADALHSLALVADGHAGAIVRATSLVLALGALAARGPENAAH